MLRIFPVGQQDPNGDSQRKARLCNNSTLQQYVREIGNCSYISQIETLHLKSGRTAWT